MAALIYAQHLVRASRGRYSQHLLSARSNVQRRADALMATIDKHLKAEPTGVNCPIGKLLIIPNSNVLTTFLEARNLIGWPAESENTLTGSTNKV